MRPVFSAIIPVYNGEKFVARAIRSVLDQEYPAHEVIVIDDGSTDGTPEVLRSFGNRIRTKRIANSGGASRPRNVGIEMAAGDYIAFLDADDFWFRHKLKVVSESIAKYPEIRFFSSDHFERSDATRHRLARHSALIRDVPGVCFDAPLKTDPLEILLRENFVGTPSGIVVKKEVFGAAGHFNDIYTMAEDLEFYLRVALTDNFVILSAPLFFKHDHPGNMSTQKIKLYNGHRDVLVNFYDGYHRALEKKGYIQVARQALAYLDYILGNVYFEAGHRTRAFSFYFQGFMNAPSLSNLSLFSRAVIKKAVRLATFDRVSRKKIGY